MKYYRRNPGDYLSATGHLTLVEHGAYNVLMDTYYATENALPADPKALYRIAGAHDARERAAVDRVIGEFFHRVDDEMVQDRIEIEIASGREKSQKLSENGSKGADARTRNRLSKEQANAQAIAQAIAKQKPRHIHQPSTITEANASENPSDADASLVGDDVADGLLPGIEKQNGAGRHRGDSLAPCPHLAIIEAYNAALPDLPQARHELWDGSERAEHLRARWKWVLTAKKRNGERYATNAVEALDFFRRYFAYVGSNSFLTGRNGKWSGCDLGWLVKRENFAKVVQGNYDGEKQ